MHRILLVDDQGWPMDRLADLLCRSPNMEIERATGFEEVMAILMEDEASCDAVITDFDMERLNGRQLLSILRGIFAEGDECVTAHDEDFNFDRVGAIDEEIGDTLLDHFENESSYLEFLDRFRETAFVVFSAGIMTTLGRAHDLDADPVTADVLVTLKDNRDGGNDTGELEILEFLAGHGIPLLPQAAM